MRCIVPVFSRLLSALLLSAALSASQALISTAAAEVTLPGDVVETMPAPPDAPSAVLDIIRERAANNRVLRSYLAMVHDRATTPEGRQDIEQQLLNALPDQGMAADFPVALGNSLGMEAAQERARFVADALSADIDGNWQVTLEETRILLQAGRAQGTAAAFILSDTDGNAVLTMEEIMAAAEAQIRNRPGRSGRQADMIAVFDLDGDGLLTRDEFNRSLDALAAAPPY